MKSFLTVRGFVCTTALGLGALSVGLPAQPAEAHVCVRILNSHVPASPQCTVAHCENEIGDDDDLVLVCPDI